ncbi:hypothetical protein B0H17DRAFT_1078258 [Mycena rosella]|uniref:Uncharacterized protein n=1 Tax=Mycena rosella TaxID=1033263 RepID=A0AAD7D4Q6_MYCRO|nr:hypothetical protein B0H17DRAFT_1078258 [Mycena rosella]
MNGRSAELMSECLERNSPCGDLAASHRSTGVFFPNSQDFVVSGGEFTNVTKIYTSSAPPRPFSDDPAGGFGLAGEIDGGTVEIRRRRGHARRIYSARIDGRSSNMTVAVYQENSAEEAWLHELERYSRFATSNGLYATVFHDELMPLNETLKLYRHWPISTVYLLGIFAMDVTDAEDYVESVTGEWLDLDSTLWIRASTGRLCVELTPSGEYYTPLLSAVWAERLPVSLLSHGESMTISALTLGQYQSICSSYLELGQSVPIHPDETVKMGTIISTSGNHWRLKNLAVVAWTADPLLDDSGWTLNVRSDAKLPKPLVMGNGWTLFTSAQIAKNASLHRTIDSNHIFTRLNITSEYEHYRIGDGMWFRRPELLAYWALDPSGMDRLRPAEAVHLGFPELILSADWKKCLLLAEVASIRYRWRRRAKVYRC